MRNLAPRLERLERQVASAAACYCWTVVRDEEEAPRTCPHGRPWAGVIRIVHVERGLAQT
jgi:hypothetical protein